MFRLTKENVMPGLNGVPKEENGAFYMLSTVIYIKSKGKPTLLLNKQIITLSNKLLLILKTKPI